MSSEASPQVRTCRAILRRMKFVDPSLGTISAPGTWAGFIEEACREEGLSVVPSGMADGELHVAPDGPFASAPSSARIVAVVAESVDSETLTQPHSERPASHYIPLREWVAGWMGKSSFLQKLFVSPAVGDRLWRVAWQGKREWIFSPAAQALPKQNGMDFAKFLLVTTFGAGLCPILPATVASLVLVPFALLAFGLLGLEIFVIAAAVLALASTVGSLLLEKWAGRYFLAEDPREFTLDEVAGLSLTWAMLPEGSAWWAILVGFVFFRIFDIFKWGVSWVEDLPIRGGIVWDDLLAGVYAGICTAIFIACMHALG